LLGKGWQSVSLQVLREAAKEVATVTHLVCEESH
jgi:hypothetical protein